MKAIVQDVYGSADVLELRDIDRPSIGDDEVLVQVRAAGVDPGVWHLMTGEPYLIRAMGFGLRKPKVTVRGRDLAGVVTAVGAGVTRFRPGDEVYGTCESGSFAEYAAAPQGRLAPKPAGISFEQAAVTPISAVTALQAVRDCGRVQPGQQVMVIGVDRKSTRLNSSHPSISYAVFCLKKKKKKKTENKLKKKKKIVKKQKK